MTQDMAELDAQGGEALGVQQSDKIAARGFDHCDAGNAGDEGGAAQADG